METVEIIEPLQTTTRYLIQNRSKAIRNVEMGLVEIISNANDAYQRLYQLTGVNAHRVEIGIDARTHQVFVKDFALGMTLEDMKMRLMVIGGLTKTDDSSVHGIFSRGAKDVTELGKITFVGLRNGEASKLVIGRDLKCELFTLDFAATKQQHFPNHERGLVVTIDIIDMYWQHDLLSLVKKLELYFSLRFLFADPNKNFNIKVFSGSGDVLEDRRLQYTFPPGELTRYPFEVPGYPGVMATLDIVVCPDEIPMVRDDEQQEFGILLHGDDSIYCVQFFRTEFRSHAYMRYVHGRLYCKHVRQLMVEWDNNITTNTVDPLNSFPILNPSRHEGVNVDHPFVNKLLIFPIEQLRRTLRALQSGNTMQTFSSFGARLRNLEMFSNTYFTQSDDFQMFRETSEAKVIEGLESVSGGMHYTHITQDQLKLQLKSETSDEGTPDENPNIYSLYTVLDETAANSLKTNLMVNREGDLVEVQTIDGVPEGEYFVRASRDNFDLKVSFDDSVLLPAKPMTYDRAGLEIEIIIYLHHRMVKGLIRKEGDVLVGLEDRAAQRMVCALIGRAMGRLLASHYLDNHVMDNTNRYQIADKVLEIAETSEDRFTQEVFENFIPSQGFQDYVNSI